MFAFAPARGPQVLHAVLGEGFGGVLGCDSFSAYRKYHKDTGVRLQLCLGHPIRDFRFLTTLHGAAHFRFIEEPGVEPTNNRAEQAIRFVVIDRHVTQGTRSEGGQRWCERIWSERATWAAQERSAHQYLCEAVQAHFTGQPANSLLPDTP